MASFAPNPEKLMLKPAALQVLIEFLLQTGLPKYTLRKINIATDLEMAAPRADI
jgi:hypothetical protein